MFLLQGGGKKVNHSEFHPRPPNNWRPLKRTKFQTCSRRTGSNKSPWTLASISLPLVIYRVTPAVHLLLIRPYPGFLKKHIHGPLSNINPQSQAMKRLTLISFLSLPDTLSAILCHSPSSINSFLLAQVWFLSCAKPRTLLAGPVGPLWVFGPGLPTSSYRKLF